MTATYAQLFEALQNVKPTGEAKWKATCPCHDDQKPSLNLEIKGDKLVCHCPVCGSRGSDVCKALDLPQSVMFREQQSKGNGRGSCVAKYVYRDADGNPYRQILKFVKPDGGKEFPQQRWAGSEWASKLDEQQPIPYRLPELLASDGDTVFVAEGEKDADSVAGLDLTATCNPGGAGKWTAELNGHFKDRHVAVLPDNDEPGRRHAHQVAKHLHLVAASVRIVALPDLPAKGDVSDWIAAGGTAEELRDLVMDADLWEPQEQNGEPPPHEDPDWREAEGSGETETSCAPYAVTCLNDRAPVATEWLVNGILTRESCALIAASQKAGKTWWTFVLAISVATGRPFFGQSIRHVGRVLLYSPESGWEARRRRLWGLCWAQDLDPREVLANILIIRERMDLNADGHAARLEATIQKYDPVLIIVDPFVTAATGVEENSAGDVQPILSLLRDVGTTDGRTLVLAHHHAKGPGTLANSVRGSSAFGGWWDTLVTLRRKDADRWDSPRRVDIEHRDEAAPEAYGFEIVAEAHQEAAPGCTAFRLTKIEAPDVSLRGQHNKDARGQRTEDLLCLLSKTPGIAIKDLAIALAVDERTIRRYLKDLEEDGKVRRAGNHVFPA